MLAFLERLGKEAQKGGETRISPGQTQAWWGEEGGPSDWYIPHGSFLGWL